jgi:hypothetical protein
LSKTWLNEGERWGGFYIFNDSDATQAYLDGPIIADTKAVPAFSDWEVRHFTVIDKFSKITRGVPAGVASSAG